MRKTANEYNMEKSLVFFTFCLYISSVFSALSRDALFPTADRSCELSNVMGAGAGCGYGTLRSSANEDGRASGDFLECAEGARPWEPPNMPGERPRDPRSEYTEYADWGRGSELLLM
jgi:hypothetical protein